MLTTVGTAQWDPNMDEDVFDTLISSLIQTPKLVKTMGRHTRIAIQATTQLAPSFSCPPERRGLIVCQGNDRIDYSEITTHLPSANDHQHTYTKAARRTPPLWLLQQLPNMTAAHLAREWNIRGATHSFSQPELPFDQGHTAARLLFDLDEVDELLFTVVDVTGVCTAATWHFSESPELLTMEFYRTLFPTLT